uniref:DUF1330 domain-containing protein n=1 Tax=Magallana gigas TaxID=29159 RepID=A0A8W8KGI0_MAGGI
RPDEAIEMSYKLATDVYMQQTTYKHDYNPAGGISPRNRQTNYPYGADAPKADIPGPYNNFRPRYGDPLPQHIRDLDGQRFDDQPLTDRQRIKRGEEWIGGRRYDEPMTDRGQYYERERGRDLSPYRYQDRGRNGSPERYYDRGRDNGRGRDFDRRRDESPGKYDRPAQPMIDSYADHRKMTDRTTYKDYGEFLQEKIKLDELKKQPVEYPAANLPKSTNSGVYLFIRTNKLAKADVVKALQEGRSVLANSYGQLKGIATNREISLLEGRPDGWTHQPSVDQERTWNIDDIVLVIWFPTSKEAEMWLRHEKHFRNAAFPEFYGSDVVSLPINWNPTNDRHYPTFLVTEFEGIVDPDQFREKFAVNMSDVLHRHEAERFVIQTVGIKHLRGNWFKPKSVVTCTRFPSSEAALRFFHDPEYERLRRSVRDISKNRTTVMFTLTERPV